MKNINENVIDDMKKIVKNKSAMKINGVMVDLYTASAVTKIYDKVNPANKKKMENMSPQGLATAAFKILGKKESVSEDVKDADEKKKLLLGKNKDEMTPKQKLTFDVLMKKLDGGKEHMKFKRMAKTPAQGDDLFHGYVSDLAKKTMKEVVNEAMKPSQVRSAISKVKKGLMRKWKQKGGYENFGQKELSQMKDKFDYNPYGSSDERQISKMLDGFDNWAMNYDGNMREELDNEGGMALSQLRTAKSAVEDLMASIQEMDNLPEWVQSKLTKAVDYMDSIRDYMASKDAEEYVEEVELGESVSEEVGTRQSGPITLSKERKAKLVKVFDSLKVGDTVKIKFKRGGFEKQIPIRKKEVLRTRNRGWTRITFGDGVYLYKDPEEGRVVYAHGRMPSEVMDMIKESLEENVKSVVTERKLTDAEMDKREKVAKAIEKDNPDMPMGKKMAIATNVAKGVQMENDAKKKDDKKKDKVKLKDRLDKVTKHEFTPLQKAGLGTALISLGAGTTAQNIVSANENLIKTATKQTATTLRKNKNKKNEIKRKNSIEEEEISEALPLLALAPAAVGAAGRFAAGKAAKLAATRGGAATLKGVKKVKSGVTNVTGKVTNVTDKSTNISRPFAKHKDGPLKGTRKKYTRGGLAMGALSTAGTVDHVRVYGKNDKLKSQLAAKNGTRAESADVDEASAYADARRAFKKDDKRGLASLKKDTDDSATESDKKAANKNIIMQLRKAADLPNGAEVIFPSGTKKVDRRTAQQMLVKFNSLKKSFEKDKFQKSIKSLSDVKKILGR